MPYSFSPLCLAEACIIGALITRAAARSARGTTPRSEPTQEVILLKMSLSDSPPGAHSSLVEDSTMRLRAIGLCVLLTSGLLAVSYAAYAQQRAKVPRIGNLN